MPAITDEKAKFEGKKSTIKCEDQKALIEIIKTVPALPLWADIHFSASKVEIPFNKEDPTEYLADCEARKLVPYLKMKLMGHYDWEIQKFTPKIEINLNNARPQTLSALVKGYRPADIEVHTLHPEEFADIKKSYLDDLLQKYEISSARLVLTSHHLTGYNQGEYEDTQIMIGAPWSKGMELKFGHNLADLDCVAVDTWWKGLVAKYDKK